MSAEDIGKIEEILNTMNFNDIKKNIEALIDITQELINENMDLKMENNYLNKCLENINENKEEEFISDCDWRG